MYVMITMIAPQSAPAMSFEKVKEGGGGGMVLFFKNREGGVTAVTE